MTYPPNKSSLEGVTLEQILGALVERFGWTELGKRIKIRCFTSDPSIKSSLTFLRRTPWARQKVENLYIWSTKKTEQKPRPFLKNKAVKIKGIP